MLGRTSKATLVEQGSSAGSRAVDVVGEAASELAERAVTVAQNAQRVATPIIRSAAERSAPVLRTAAEKSAGGLSHAAERASAVLADTAGKLADTSESLSAKAAPKKRRGLRRLLAVVLLAGGIAALVRSPLKGKIADRLFGAPPEFDDDEPESITLPSSSTTESTPGEDAPTTRSTETTSTEEPLGSSASDESSIAELDGSGANGVASSASGKDEGSQA